MANETTNETTSKTRGIGEVFLDVLDKAASWDILRKTGLPIDIDGGVSGPVIRASDRQVQEQVPPAPPGGTTGFQLPAASGNTLLIGGAVLLGAVGLYLALK